MTPVLGTGRGRLLRGAVAVGGVGLVIWAVWAVMRWASAPAYISLYQDLEYKDASDIAESLAGAGIPHRLGTGGTEIQVPVSEVARARVALAKDGRPAAGRPGLELFDKPSWGMTEFTQRVTFQRALEGELARTIAGIRGIERAQVHLALPAPSAFRRPERQATASVVIALAPGVVLSPATIQGITYVVSNSVEELSPDNVAVMNADGHPLSVPVGRGGEGGASSRQMELQRSIEEGLVEKIHSLLEPVLGPGRVRAEVAAQLSFDQVDRATETFIPHPGAADSSIAAREFESSRVAAGRVTRLTAAVLVAERAAATTTAVDSLQIARLTRMVGDAIGIDETRGDRLTVMAVPFDTVTALPASTGSESAGSKLEIVEILDRVLRPVVGIAALIVLALLAFKIVSSLPARAVWNGAAQRTPDAGGREASAHGGPTNGGRLGPGGHLEANPEASLKVVRSWLKQS